MTISPPPIPRFPYTFPPLSGPTPLRFPLAFTPRGFKL